MSDKIDNNEEQLLAAEYALGLLAPEEAAAFELLLSEDPNFRADFARWAEDFADLTRDIDPVTPPEDVLVRIKQAVFVPEMTNDGFVTVAVNEAGAIPAKGTPAENAPRPSPAPSQDTVADMAQSWMQRLGLLPWVGGGLVAALIVLSVVDFGALLGVTTPVAMATLASADDSLIVEVAYSEDGKTLEFNRKVGSAPEGQALQLWLVPEGGNPISLGVLPDDASGTIAVSYLLRDRLRGASCAISIEAPGGSTTGSPSDDIVAIAPIVWDA